MSFAMAAANFRAPHHEAVVFMFGDGLIGNRLKEARPPATGIELRVRPKQLVSAAGATVCPSGKLVPIPAGKGAFGARFSKNMKLVRS